MKNNIMYTITSDGFTEGVFSTVELAEKWVVNNLVDDPDIDHDKILLSRFEVDVCDSCMEYKWYKDEQKFGNWPTYNE